MKYEIAREVGVNLKQGYNGDIAAKDKLIVWKIFRNRFQIPYILVKTFSC
jgi:hypothetical protein